MLIGILGNLGSGKDTMGNHLKEHYGFNTLAFGDAVKHHAKHNYPTRLQMNYRETLQYVGSLIRKEDPDHWVNITMGVVEYLRAVQWGETKEDANIVITDVRYQNEIDAIKAADGIIIQINVEFEELCRRNRLRSGAKGEQFDPAHFNHESEMLANKPDVGDMTIRNNFTEEQFLENIDTLMIRLGVDKYE